MTYFQQSEMINNEKFKQNIDVLSFYLFEILHTTGEWAELGQQVKS